MNFRKVFIGLMAAAMVTSLGVTAQTLGGDELRTVDDATVGVIDDPDDREQVVEGHTVYTKIDNPQGNPQAAVVVFVENQTRGDVLWFDDSFLHEADNNPACGGSVWATHEQGVLLENKGEYQPDKTYVIDDPENAVTWRVTEYEFPGATGLLAETRAWAVDVQVKTKAGVNECTAFFADGITRDGGDSGDGVFETYPGPNGGSDAKPPDVPGFRYNALLWFEFGFGHLQEGTDTKEFGCNPSTGVCGEDAESHKTASGDPDEREPPQDDANETSDFEGNSHPYNTGEANEDDGGEPAPIHTHPTANIALYFDASAPTPEASCPSDCFFNDLGGFHPHRSP